MTNWKGFRSGSNSNGQFWYGKTTDFPGFIYKKNVGVGGRRSTKMSAGGNTTCNTPQYIYNKYTPGQGGVGASSIANRRAKNRHATICTTNSCFPYYMSLGQYSNYTHNPNGFIPLYPISNLVAPVPAPVPGPGPGPGPGPVPIPVVPTPPLNVNAVKSNFDEVTITFSNPISDGGSPITSYTISTTFVSRPDLSIPPVTGTSSPVIIQNLPPNIPYIFNVIATNAIGNSNPSLSSQIVEPDPQGSTITSFTTIGSTTWTAPPTVTYIDYLIVDGGGGGGGAYDYSAGGGGGGGLALTERLNVTPGNVYDIVVGAGGAGAVRPLPYVSGINSAQNNGSSGDSSSFDTIVAEGGGFGYKSRTAAPGTRVGEGGLKADGITPPTGGGGGTGPTNLGGGGGGGNESNGSTTTNVTGGNGGTGVISLITGVSKTYGVGGKGGSKVQNSAGTAGGDNTGNGGGGGGISASNNVGGANGGSGIVVIQYFY